VENVGRRFELMAFALAGFERVYHGGLDRNPNRNTPSWVNYVVVRVDQPSVTYVSSIASDAFPEARVGVAAPW